MLEEITEDTHGDDPYDAALYVAFDRLKRTDYPRYRRNAHRIQCARPARAQCPLCRVHC